MPMALHLLVLLWLSILQPASSSFNHDDLKSPLDVSYVLNDLNNLLQDTGRSSSSAGGPYPDHQNPPGAYPDSRNPPGAYPDSRNPPGSYPESQHPSLGTEVYADSKTLGAASEGLQNGEAEWSQYSNNAGDALYNTKQGSADGYHPPQNNYPLRDDVGPDSSYLDQQGDPINPKNAHHDGGGSSQRGGLGSFGPGLPNNHYPIQIPVSSPDAEYSGHVLGAHVPQNRQLLPDPYTGGDAPYPAAQQNTGDGYGYGDSGSRQQPGHTSGGHGYQNNNYNNNNNNNNNNNYGDVFAHTGESGVQIPQESYQPASPPKDLSSILIHGEPPVPIASRPPLLLDNYPKDLDTKDVSDPGFYPDPDTGYVGGGAVVGTPPHSTGGVGGLGGGALVGGGGPSSGGQYVVEPQHSYPTDVNHYRDQLQCWPQFFLQYERDFTGAVWQDVKGHVHVSQGRAVFEGQGFLAIPFFACNDLLPRYSMLFVISPTYSSGSGGRPQAVLGNSVFPSHASLLVSLWDHTLTLVIRQRAPGLTPKQLLEQCHQHPADQHDRRRRSVGSSSDYYGSGSSIGVSDPGFQPRQPTYGSADTHYGSQHPEDIVVLQLRISGEVMVTIAQENGQILFSAGDQHTYKAGRLPTLTKEALYVGAGADPRGGGPLPHYTGTFDSFLFEKCP